MINVTVLLLLVAVSGVAPNKFRRFASTSFDAFTKYPPVPPLPSTESPEESSTIKEIETQLPVNATVIIPESESSDDSSPDIAVDQTISVVPEKTIVLEKSQIEQVDPVVVPVVTRPANLKNLPIREQTVTQTDWFDPFTNTPWHNGVEYNTDYISGNAIPHAQDEQNAAISSSKIVSYCSTLIVFLLLASLWL